MASTQNYAATASDHSHSNSPGSSSQHSPAYQGSRLSRFDSEVPSSSASKTSLSRRAARRSLSVLGSLPKEISALIRSHSLSRRQHPCQQDIYGDTDDMPIDDDRPSRKSKSENRLYNFLTRSRSRSRTKNDCVTSVDPGESIPDLPQGGRAIHSSKGPVTPSKPPTRIQSRPLSSTTTATNTTITPSTPRPKKRLPSAIVAPEVGMVTNLERSPSRPETPKASNTRKKLHTLFGIPLSSPRKSSFSSSRQGSRRPSIDLPPPFPGQEDHEVIEDCEPTPRPRSPQVTSRPESPSPSPHLKILALNASNSSTATSSTSASSKLQKFFSGHKSSAPSAPSAENVSGPLRRPSGSSHHRSNSNSSQPRGPSPSVVPSRAKHGIMGPPPVPPPKIINTPATPLRSEPSPRPSTTPVSHAPRLSQRKNSMDSGYRYHANATMGVVDEGTVLNGIGLIGKGKERELGSLSVIGLPNGGTRSRVHAGGTGHPSRSTKHGSFDFERPGWSATGAIQRSGSNGTTGTGTSGTSGGWGRNADNFLGGARESVMGPGLAGVGTLQREASMKRGKEREEMIKRAREEERRRRKGEVHPKEAERGQMGQRHRSLQPPQRKPDSEDNSGKSSSLGKKRGGLLRVGSTGGKGRATALGLAHGLFAFEPPVPSPTRSTGSMGTGTGEAPLSVSWGGERGRIEPGIEGERVKIKEDLEREREKERYKSQEKQFSSYRGDRAPVPVPGASVGHRSGTKGRSLDLGLGLAWAPTKVREDALLPTSGYFGRSLSGTSSVTNGRSLGSNSGRSASGSTNGVDEKDRSKVGREVAEVFHSALDDDGYAAFKKYVHRFDAHEIPFDGPTGIVSRVEHLLKSAPALSDEGKRRLLDSFVRIILQNA
ncbi:hypothetical protein BDZ94DRAFT_451357 [Collybia nuda]|uniref:Uncharacterized protein n=1 Tax=Collybia nuda TaxID=64659 RepID=A0A9P6CGB7_9AGAR|nr:hypothetical protein BDZ94DRAFT_451357 [Collybia nuda]